jgi:hypothetical protein
MGRPSNLTEKQWSNIGERLLKGEKLSALAREYKTSKSSISIRFSKRNETIKATASLVLEGKNALNKLTIPEQIAVSKQVELLQSIQDHLLNAANYGASTAHKANMFANIKMEGLDPSLPLTDPKNLEIARDAMSLSQIAKEASIIGREFMSEKNRVKDDGKKVIEHQDRPTIACPS